MTMVKISSTKINSVYGNRPLACDVKGRLGRYDEETDEIVIDLLLATLVGSDLAEAIISAIKQGEGSQFDPFSGRQFTPAPHSPPGPPTWKWPTEQEGWNIPVGPAGTHTHTINYDSNLENIVITIRIPATEYSAFYAIDKE